LHTAYVPADAYDAGTAMSWGEQALDAVERHGVPARELSAATGLPVPEVAGVLARTVAKLQREPVEDLRIDFEDGYGLRRDDSEGADAVRTARALAESLQAGGAPPFHGIRIKSVEPDTRTRALRTLRLFVAELAGADRLDDGFVVTLPKASSVAEVAELVQVCTDLEREHTLPHGRLRLEIQVETPRAILAADGTCPLPAMIAASDGRCVGLHYGTYDYSAALGIAPDQQSSNHPVADHAKQVMQVAAAAAGVAAVDGSTNILPVGGRRAVRAAWRVHAGLVTRALERGFHQGWDLHPAQLVTRYLATYAFYRSGSSTALRRLRAYLDTRDSGFLDEPATAAALAGFLLRGLDCGALDDAEVSGLDRDFLVALTQR
jgi:citrate lyase beta subunit